VTRIKPWQGVVFLLSLFLLVGVPSAAKAQLTKDLNEHNPKQIDVIITVQTLS